MGRLIPLTALKRNGQTFSKPRVVYLQEDAIKVNLASKSNKHTVVIEELEKERNVYEVYEKAMHIEAQRNPSSSDILVKQHIATGLAGVGTTQGAGASLTKYFNEATTIGAGATEAFVLPAATVGKVIVVLNNDAANDQAKVFPASGESINGQADDAVYSITGGNRIHFVCLVAGEWVIAEDFGK